MADNLIEKVGYLSYRQKYAEEKYKVAFKSIMLSLYYIEENFELEDSEVETLTTFFESDDEPETVLNKLKKFVDEAEESFGDDLEEPENQEKSIMTGWIKPRIDELYEEHKHSRNQQNAIRQIERAVSEAPVENHIPISNALQESDDPIEILKHYGHLFGISKGQTPKKSEQTEENNQTKNGVKKYRKETALFTFLKTLPIQLKIGVPVLLLALVILVVLFVNKDNDKNTGNENIPTTIAQVTQEVSSSPTPVPTQTPIPTEDLRTKYQALYWKTNETSKESVGRSGPGTTYPEIEKEVLLPDQWVKIVPFNADPNWVIVVPSTGGAAFYPRDIFSGEPQLDIGAGVIEAAPMPAVDRLLTGISGATESTGGDVSPFMQIVLWIILPVNLFLILRESIDGEEPDDGIFSLVQGAIMIVLGALLPLAAEEVAEKMLISFALPGGEEPIVRAITSFVALWSSIILFIWAIWHCLNPIVAQVPETLAEGGETKNIWKYKLFPRIDFNPLGNMAFLAGILGLLGIQTVISLAFNVRASEGITNLKGLIDGIAIQQTPSLTAFSLTMILVAIVIYLIDNIRAGQFTATIVGVVTFGSYYVFRLRYGMELWLALPIALLVVSAVIGIMLLVSKKTNKAVRSSFNKDNIANVMLTVSAIAVWVLASFGTF